MRSRWSKRGSAGLVLGLIAVVITVGGSAFAAKHYVITSTKQISPKVLKKLKGKKGRRGRTGARGATGAQGSKGDAGQDLTFNTTLKPGQTETGVFAVAGGSSSGFMNTAVQFRPQLSAPLASSATHFQSNGTTSASCPQAVPPQAASGQLCFYATSALSGFNNIVNIEGNSAGAGTLGAEINFTLSAPAIGRGTWAVTAP